MDARIPGRSGGVRLAWAARLLPLVLLACGLSDPIPSGPSVALELVDAFPATSGSPVALVEVPDGSGRIFVLGQSGRAHVLAGGTLDPTPILDMVARGIHPTSDFEGGAVDLVFHPNFAGLDGPDGEGLFYTYGAEVPDGTPDFDHPERASVPGAGQTVLREWKMGPAAPGGGFDVVLPGSRVLMRIDQPQANHNGGGLVFDPDGLLYIGIGDGGGGNDNVGGVDSPTDGHTNGGGGNGQDRANVFGNVLRIDPLGSDSANGQYGIPATNPFKGNQDGWLEEIFAWGFRNPYRLALDADGALWAADVGQGQREEIDWVTPGGNYGWPYFEGTRVNRTGGPSGTVAPVGEYTHGDGTAVLGGYFYDGHAIPALTGQYLFGDFAHGGLGQLYVMDPATGAISELVLQSGSAKLPSDGALYGVGRDGDGEIYYLVRPLPDDASLFRLGAAPGDRDGDGVADDDDLCPGVPDPAQADADGDGVGDACDVCIEAADPSQRDRNLDGVGDVCDCDFDRNGACNIADFALFVSDLIVGAEATLGTDMNGDGAVDITDFTLLLPGFVQGAPGPSAP